MMKRCYLLATCLALLTAASGCSPSAPPATGDATSGATAEGSHSHAKPPHGGTLTDWGGGAYHVEFTVDHDKKETVVYIIGSDAKTPAPVKADKVTLMINEPAFMIDLAPLPLEGESAGTSSRFSGTHESLGIVREFSGTISGEVDGTPYTGDFKEEPHGSEHGHSH